MDTETINGLIVTLHPDDSCESPREWCRLCTLYYRSGSRYTLGDEGVSDDYLHELANGNDPEENEADPIVWSAPVYAYIHGNVALSLGGFSCPWDSGCCGYAVIRQSNVDENGTSPEDFERVVKSELEEFTKWLNGDCWGFVVTDEDGEELDSCWGHIGSEWAMEAGKESAEYLAKKRAEDAELNNIMTGGAC